MKTKILSAVLTIAAIIPLRMSATPRSQETETLTIMSFNIRFGLAEDGKNSWKHRRTATISMIEDLAPDVIGMQEAFSFQINYISENFPDYGWVGKSRLDRKDAEHPVVFYNKRKIKLIDWGNFWLSDTPQHPSLGWDAAFERNATWLLLKDRKSGGKFFLVNTHLDHVGKTARQQGLEMLLATIGKMNTEDLPVVLTGDLNAEDCDPAIGVLCGKMLDARKTAKDSDDMGTYNGWGNSNTSIDYIWYSGFRRCIAYETVQKEYGNIEYISDHYPIKAVLEF